MAWIVERRKKLELESQSIASATSHEKVNKKLQKQQALEKELAAHEPTIKSIQVNGDLLLQKDHPSSLEIQHQLDELKRAWTALNAESLSLGRDLEDTQRVLQFDSQVEELDRRIRVKEAMVNARDAGRDYEHCLSLQRKLDDTDKQDDDSQMQSINALADQLVSQGRSDVQQRREELNHR